MGEQVTLFDPDLWFGKMSPEPLVQTEGRTSKQSSKRSSALRSRRLPTFHYLPKGSGRWQTPTMLAAYLMAVDDRGMAYVLREVYEGKDLGEGAVGLNIHDAAERVRTLMAGERVTAVLAPPDLWAKQRESGKTTADLFAEHGVYLTQASAARVAGWLAVKEWLRPFPDGEGGRTAKLRIFPRCVNLIRTLPLLQYDEKKPSDASGEPHELTHAPDAIRYFCASWTLGGEMPEEAYDEDMPGTVDHGDYLAGGEPGEDYLNFGG